MGSTVSGNNGERIESAGELHPVWVVAILLWMSVGLGTYFFKMLTLPGRLERLLQLLRSLLG